MSEKCFDEGMIQAYVDGELASELSKAVLRHVGACNECGLILSKAEEENEFVFSALSEELGVFVPTERLREKVFASIREIEQRENRSLWQKLSGSFAFLGTVDFRNPSLVALSCTFLFVGTFVVAMNFYPRVPDFGEVVFNDGQIDLLGGVDFTQALGTGNIGAGENAPPKADTNVRTPGPRRPRRLSRRARYNRQNSAANSKVRVNVVYTVPAIDGEDSYLQTIAALGKDIENSKDQILAPGERVAFERDLAVVNDAITRLKVEVGKNPNNNAAKRILKATYQNKIDLLNSVAEKNELMASMQ